MKHFILRNGDTLSYCEYGDLSSNTVLLYAHGFPGTGYEAGIAHRAALERNIRIIAPTRPGIEESTFDPSRSITQWHDTVNQLLSSLDVDQIYLLGVSGGTPYALEYLRSFPERVKKCLIVSGMGPPNSVHLDRSMSIFSRIPLWLAYNLPQLAKILIALIAFVSRRSPNTLLACYRICMSKDDRKILRGSTNAKNIVENFRLALLQGSKGVYHDFRLLTSDWGFSLAEITQPIQFFHGDQDRLVPLSIARQNVRQLPNALLKEFRGRGHFMALDLSREIIDYFIRSEQLPAQEIAQTTP